ncbi:hypothetical protein [Nocardia altamirensis]|uniref:hypothetical protein n=1 Tax=Nocardia altamirensis TaxID=472158 RepID=UPI0008401877|nr:hypothetical protein [Nocardia altamirensis]
MAAVVRALLTHFTTRPDPATLHRVAAVHHAQRMRGPAADRASEIANELTALNTRLTTEHDHYRREANRYEAIANGTRTPGPAPDAVHPVHQGDPMPPTRTPDDTTSAHPPASTDTDAVVVAGFTVTVPADLGEFAIDEDAFARWVVTADIDTIDDLDALLPRLTREAPGEDLAELITAARNRQVLTGDPRLHLQLLGDDAHDDTGYHILIRNNGAHQRLLAVTSGSKPLDYPDTTDTAAAMRHYLTIVCTNANALLGDMARTPAAPPLSAQMQAFENAARQYLLHPPTEWTVKRVTERRWDVVDLRGATIATRTTRKAARAAIDDGPERRVWDQNREWYLSQSRDPRNRPLNAEEKNIVTRILAENASPDDHRGEHSATGAPGYSPGPAPRHAADGN